MAFEDMCIPSGLRSVIWVILAIHFAALVGLGPAGWFDVWYMRISWCAGLLAATTIITTDWLARHHSAHRARG